jgi:hypothetical protein
LSFSHDESFLLGAVLTSAVFIFLVLYPKLPITQQAFPKTREKILGGHITVFTLGIL